MCAACLALCVQPDPVCTLPKGPCTQLVTARGRGNGFNPGCILGTQAATLCCPRPQPSVSQAATLCCPRCADVLRVMLKQLGCSSDHAIHGEQALEQLMFSEPGLHTLVLMDLRMSVMDGAPPAASRLQPRAAEAAALRV